MRRTQHHLPEPGGLRALALPTRLHERVQVSLGPPAVTLGVGVAATVGSTGCGGGSSVAAHPARAFLRLGGTLSRLSCQADVFKCSWEKCPGSPNDLVAGRKSGRGPGKKLSPLEMRVLLLRCSRSRVGGWKSAFANRWGLCHPAAAEWPPSRPRSSRSPRGWACPAAFGQASAGKGRAQSGTGCLPSLSAAVLIVMLEAMFVIFCLSSTSRST